MSHFELANVVQDEDVETKLVPHSYTAKRALDFVPSHSFGNIKSGNLLIQGCNTQILPFLKGWGLCEKIKLVYLDPPYNNQESYTHYHDKWNHEDWLQSMSEMLMQLPALLSEDGSVWISIDDREMHYLKVEADKVFGRENFVTTIVWQQRNTRENRKLFSQNHEYILVYAKDKAKFKKARNLLPASEALLKRYQNIDNDPRGAWQSISAHVQAGHGTTSQFYSIKSPSGRIHTPPNGRCWIYNKERMLQEIEKGNIWFGKNGTGVPRIKKFATSSVVGLVPETIWPAAEVGTSSSAKKQILSFFPSCLPFDTPKPEPLIERIVQIATNPGDLVLDPYLGSGTTCVVAQKHGRKYIGIEKGAQVVEFCLKRLTSVLKNGDDKKSSGFAFYKFNDSI